MPCIYKCITFTVYKNTNTMTTLTRANQITSEIRESVNTRLAEINEMFQMGFISNIEKYEMSQKVKSELTSYYNLSK